MGLYYTWLNADEKIIKYNVKTERIIKQLCPFPQSGGMVKTWQQCLKQLQDYFTTLGKVLPAPLVEGGNDPQYYLYPKMLVEKAYISANVSMYKHDTPLTQASDCDNKAIHLIDGFLAMLPNCSVWTYNGTHMTSGVRHIFGCVICSDGVFEWEGEIKNYKGFSRVVNY